MMMTTISSALFSLRFVPDVTLIAFRPA